ncbi:Aste57867_12888 [Aphanomyces stellatus]|uniref:Purple acid phosphatase n=1 Tax=Aphanomyces stellatus TaxID=120398 RepID=A0A485KX64_9STRA|nr:hypothetical protein As57867_012840 [Aphanomyces stellatus]VFT89735.1 Aste57867_12888 [Aphanomyces stellatus]
MHVRLVPARDSRRPTSIRALAGVAATFVLAFVGLLGITFVHDYAQTRLVGPPLHYLRHELASWAASAPIHNDDDDDDDSYDVAAPADLNRVENCVPFDITSSRNDTHGEVSWSTKRMYREGKDEAWIECGNGRGGLQLRAVDSPTFVPFPSHSVRDVVTNITTHHVSLATLDATRAYDFVVGSAHHGFSNLHRLGRNVVFTSAEARRCRPRRIHTAYGETPDSYSFQWSTPIDCAGGAPRVWLEEGTAATFSTDSVRLVEATTVAFGARLEHTAYATGLRTSTRHSYVVGNDAYSRSIVHSFRTAAGAGDDTTAPLRFLVTGDIGYQNAATLPMMQAAVARDEVDAVVSVGDYAYDLHTSGGAVGDVFLNEMEPIAASVPFMVAMGNHEVKKAFSHYTHRFQLMPANAGAIRVRGGNINALRNNWFYSYNVGLVHFVVLCTEMYFKPNEMEPDLAARQQAWLDRDLVAANENRTAAPWVIVIGHRPLYCTSDAQCDANAAVLRDAFEDIFYTHGVDLYLCGHQHNYERMFDVYRNATERRTTDMRATTYILTGAAGQSKVLPVHKPFERPPAPYDAFRNSIFGFSRLVVYNASHLQWQQIECDPYNPAAMSVNGRAIDDVWLVQTRHGRFNL